MRIHWSFAALATAAVVWGTTPAVAQQRSEAQTKRQQGEAQTQDQATPETQNQRDQAARPSHVFRATDVDGMTVRDEQGRNFGEVEEFLVDWESGRVPYAIVATGGFLELGEKMFAIPLAALDYQKKTQDDAHFLRAKLSQERLVQAPSFDNQNWPTFDAQWRQRIDRFYNVQGTEAAAYRPQENAKRQPDETAQRGTSNLHRSSQLIGATVRNSAGEDIGDINELVIDIGRGELRYAALSFGGFLGLGEKLYAIPHQSMKLVSGRDDKEIHFVLNVSQEKLENAPGFNKDNWPAVADPKWSQTIDKHFGVSREKEAGSQQQQQQQSPRQ